MDKVVVVLELIACEADAKREKGNKVDRICGDSV